MSIAITRTKIHIPKRRAELLSRPRLNAILADLLDYTFTLISAPAGYGKTSLMIDLAHQASYPACWYSIDPLDKDPKRFLAHLIHAIKLEFPEFGKSSLNLLDSLPEPLNPPEQIVSTLINEIYNSISENFVIFLDDYHLVDNQIEINSFISQFGQQVDENTHLILSSRKLFNFPDIPRLISHRQVKGVNQEDLAFQPSELRELYQVKLGQPISEEDCSDMIDNTAGWITGLMLRQQGHSRLFPTQDKAAKVTGTNLDSYFQEEVFENQSGAVRMMMLRTSIFEEFNESLCEKILGTPDQISWLEFIAEVSKHNLFIEEIEDNGMWIRYHHLFRDFLRRTYANQHSADLSRVLAQKVETHLESQEWEMAFDAAQKSDNPQKMAKVIESSFGPLFHAGRVKLLSDWLEILPEDGYLTNPILFSLRGFSYTELGNPKQGLSEINTAIINEQVQSNTNLLSKSLVWRSTANRMLGNYTDGISDSFNAISLIENETNVNLIKAEAHREIGLGYGRIGNYKEALKFLKKSASIYKTENDINNLAQVQMDIGLVLLNIGNFQESETFFIKLIIHWSSLGNNTQLAMIMNNLGFLSTLTGKYIEADDYFTKGEKFAKLASNSRMQAFILASRGDLAQSTKQFDESIRYYDKSETISKKIHDSYLLIYIPLAKASCFRYTNEIAQSEEILISLEEKLAQGASELEQGLWHLEWGFTQLAQGALKQAQKAFLYGEEIFSVINRPYEQAKTKLGLCLTFCKEKDKQPLTQHLAGLNKILTEMKTLNTLLPEFSHHKDSIRDLISDLPEKEGLVNYLDQIECFLKELPAIRRKLYTPPEAPSVLPILEIQGFGDVLVCYGGNRITAPEWIHQKTVREMFFYLLSHPRGVTKSHVGLAFWPNSSSSQLSCQFKNAMYRLRRAIGTNSVLYHQDNHSYTFNWNGSYTYDVEEFQKACVLAANQNDKEHRIDYLKRAVAIYKHPFAPQLEGTWVLPIRRKLHLQYEEAQLEIADYSLKAENFKACRDTCLSVLEIDACQEKAYQLCMRAFSGLSNLTELRRLYTRCEENFHRNLGIRPSNATITLFRELSK